ncbi:xanthine dehydrogenase subunit XdhC [Miniphocaeibacter massiliensis]|uniref:xanthine dehydrogenase subunit XdhC n=1 Tax=Miniphocaeibacter massiliensis TaxID=2041841 RepID=UPI000C06D9BE|nr:xanthine dehydrogenase subunit XdhC [Miniphocaeibacter massiliensis]
MKKDINFILNGEELTATVDIRSSLLELLRDDFALIGTKEGCSVGECGACTVIIDGKLVDTCIYLAVWADGKDITTIEGLLNEDGSLTDVQENYVEVGAVQCGFCTPGLVMASTQLLKDNPNPSKAEIRRGLSGNMCRCTGYKKIIDAVEKTAKERNTK